MNGNPTPEPGSTSPVPTRGFWALIVTQFQGAFSDNVVKNLVVFVALFGTSLTLAEKNGYGESIAALFALPFILFSMAGGFLADRCSKRSVMLGVKVFELLIMSLVFAGLWSLNKNLFFASVFLMGTHSAIFGPSKYGSMPELLPDRKLSWGNGILELGTFMAIILGTVAAAMMSEHFRGRQWLSGVVLIVLAVIGFASCLGITKVPAASPQKKFNPFFPAEIWRQVRAMRGDRPLWLALCGNTYFNFLGMLLLLNLFFYGSETLHVTETRIGLLNVALAMGIGLGSVAAGFLSGGKIEYGLVPLGAFGLSIFSALLAQPHISLNESYLLLALLGFAGGFFIVPIAALLQHRPARDNKGQVQATANWCSFVGVFLASVAHWVLAQKLQVTPSGIFLVGGILTLIGAAYVLILLPDALLRFVLWCVTHSIYRIHIVGRDHIPAKGGALFVCNHVSFFDALLVIASTDRPVRFMMYQGIYDRPWIKPFAKIIGTIPVSSEQRPRESINSLKAASDAIRNGEVVCIFAEGQITRIGQMLPFRRGFERIMKDLDAPIVPVALDGALGGPWSFQRGSFKHLRHRALRASGQGQLRPAATVHGHAVRGERSRAGLAGQRLATAPETDAAPASQSCPHGAATSPSHGHDGFDERQGQIRQRAGEIHFPRAPPKKNLARPTDGRNFSAAERAGCVGEPRGIPLRQGASESQLYALRIRHRLVRKSMRHQDRHHLAEIYREAQAHAAWRIALHRGPRRETDALPEKITAFLMAKFFSSAFAGTNAF